jgi:pimeloyl-ACP methyl ester carboxylesterase
MSAPFPILLIPGLLCSPRLYGPQLPALWRPGPVMIADHTRDAGMADIGRRILAAAPPRFHLAGLSMGGYIAFEILRQAPERVAKLALLDTAAPADFPEQTERRRKLMEVARTQGLKAVNDFLFPLLVHESRRGDKHLHATVDSMAEETGVDSFLRQQTALLGRPDSRPDLPSIKSPTLVMVGESDQLTPPKLAREIADGIPGARLEIIAGCGHLSTLEAPDSVNRLLVGWLGA